ncbi:MAG: hypothetical protein EU547_06810 [Promethearchaeota archaeon]|nr:MAG: hypothetical protein EU547_06810 [Candidatus Lokiarchaeota archaeon]
MNKNHKLFFIILVVLGILIRIFALIFYYTKSLTSPLGLESFGDVSLNFYDLNSIFTGEWIWSQDELAYPPLSIYFLLLFRILSFNNLYIFFFYCFLVEILTAGVFYFVLKRFKITQYKLVFGFLLINPLYYTSFVFRGIKSGYHVTDSLFCIFLLLALYSYPKESKKQFYFFSAVALSAKWYTLPILILFFIKYLREKNWNEMKNFIIFSGIPVFIFLISPVLYLPNYLDLYFSWLSGHSFTAMIPIYFKIIPFFLILLIASYKIKEYDLLDLTFLSFLMMVSVLWWSRLYVRYLAPLIYFGHIFVHEDIYTFNIEISEKSMKFSLNNHSVTYIVSIIGLIFSILITIFEYSYFGLL